MKSGTALSINDIADRNNIPAGEVSRQLPLAFLAPRIVSTILARHQPADLTAKILKRLAVLPLDWTDQTRVIGFKDI